MIAQTLDVLLRGKTEDFQTKFNQAGKTFDNFKQKVSSGGKGLVSSIGGSFGSIAGLAATYLGPITAGAFLGWGVKLAAEAESAQVGFATMLGSAEKAKLLLGEITKFASATPFESKDLRQSAQSLLSFGVDAGQVMNRLKTLGDVASGSQSDIKDLALIYGKTLAKGKFELEQGNQLAERGIPIYSTLAKQLAVTQPELMKMISAGKVSATDVQKAFETMAGAGGIFENAMQKQSTTLAGLWSTVVDNVSLLATDVGQIITEMFNFKGGLSSISDFTGMLQEQLASWKPAFFAVRDIAVEAFNGISAGISALVSFIQPAFQPVIDFLGNTFGSTMTSFRDNILSVLYAVQFGVANFPRYWELATTKTALALVSWYEDLKNLFINTIPTIFTSFGSATIDFFSNLATNIGRAIKEIWDYIKSGGKDKIDIVWEPLTTGFQKAIEDTKQAATRGVTDVEKTLMDDIQKQQDALQTDMGEFINGKMDALKQTTEESKVTLEGAATNQDQPKATSDKKPDKLEALTKGSTAALSAINAARKSDPALKELQKQNKLATDANKKLDDIASNTKSGLAVAAL